MAAKKTAKVELQEEHSNVTPEVTETEMETAAETPAEDAAEPAESIGPEDNVEELSQEEAEQEQAEEREAEAGDVDSEIQHKISRFTRALAKASKAAKKEMYSSQHIVTETGDEEVETDATQLREDYLDLAASASPRSNRILEGTIIGFSYSGEARKSTLLAKIEYGHGLFEVLIPSYLLYDYDMSKYIDPNQLQVIENNLRARINSRVKFIVRHVSEKDRMALADRLAAQAIIGHNNYFRKTQSGKPRILDGMIVKSQVIHTAPRGVIVDALGTDIFIPKTELCHSYVGDARDECQTGDYVNVKVTNIERKQVTKYDNNYTLVTAQGSVKAATPDKRPEMYKQFKVGGIYSATITYIEEAGVYCRLPGGMDILCALPRFGQNPKIGAKRIVRVTDKDDDKLFIFGLFERN